MSYVRRAKDPSDYLVIACNFTPVPRVGYRLGVPEQCWYEEVFNSDSSFYAGSNLGNGPGMMAEPSPEPRPAGLDPHYLPAVGRLRLQAAAITERSSRIGLASRMTCNSRDGRPNMASRNITMDKVELAVCALLLLAVSRPSVKP